MASDWWKLVKFEKNGWRKYFFNWVRWISKQNGWEIFTGKTLNSGGIKSPPSCNKTWQTAR